jgi:hypothetical protein
MTWRSAHAPGPGPRPGVTSRKPSRQQPAGWQRQGSVRVCVVIEGATSAETLLSILATWKAGGTASIVPSGARISAKAVSAEIDRRVEAIGARAVVASTPVLDALGRCARRPDAVPGSGDVMAIDQAGLAGPLVDAESTRRWHGPGDHVLMMADHGDGEVALFQATGGTTGEARLRPEHGTPARRRCGRRARGPRSVPLQRLPGPHAGALGNRSLGMVSHRRPRVRLER